MNENFTDEEKRLIALSDEDNKKIISAYVEGQEFSKVFMSSLNLKESKNTCYEYNEHVNKVKFHQDQIRSFTDYIETMKVWY